MADGGETDVTAFAISPSLARPIPSARRLSRTIRFHRRVIPTAFAVIGLGYVTWESIIGGGYPVNAPQVVVGFVLLGIAAPLLAFFTLSWAAQAAGSYEEAEAVREQHRERLEALNTIGEAVNQSLDLDTVLNRALDLVLHMLHLEYGQVRLVEGNDLVLQAARGVSPTFIHSEQKIPVGRCLCGRCARSGELAAIEDLTAPSAGADEMTCCLEERFRAVLTVPVRTTDRVVGVIHLASRQKRSFDASERVLLAAIGQQVGAAIEKAQLHAQLKRLNQELEARVAQRTGELLAAKEQVARHADALREVLVEERRVEERTRAHIAHDLHDGIQQLIIGALYESQAARDTIRERPEMALTRVDATQELLRRIEAEMRHAIYSLRPVALDAQGLVPALRECVASFARISRVECDLHVEGTARRFNSDAEVAAFRIMQEALNNVESHAEATHVRIVVGFGDDELQMEIVDDGCGFDTAKVAQAPRAHLGLIGMQERAKSVGGTLEVDSRVGEGTQVGVIIPMSQLANSPKLPLGIAGSAIARAA